MERYLLFGKVYYCEKKYFLKNFGKIFIFCSSLLESIVESAQISIQALLLAYPMATQSVQ